MGRLPRALAAVALTLAGCSSGTAGSAATAESAATAGTAVTTPGGAGTATAASTSSAAGAPTAKATFTIKGYTFPAFTATPGLKITLVDADAEPHTVTADDGSFDSGSFDGTAPGTLIVPTKPGRYAVHCKVHPTMHAILTVT